MTKDEMIAELNEQLTSCEDDLVQQVKDAYQVFKKVITPGDRTRMLESIKDLQSRIDVKREARADIIKELGDE